MKIIDFASCSSAIALTFGLVSAPAFAQEAASPQPTTTAQGAATPSTGNADTTNGDGQLADIIVTAEKREASAQKTPIAITVFTPEVLSRNGVGNLADLAQIAPSVGFSMVRTNAVVTIRGVSSRDTSDLGDPAVSISVDGFYYQRSIGLNDSVFDLERVEVLRGPQGTLYGRNATGGAINFITAKPKPRFEAAARVGYGAYNQLTTEGMINVPIADGVAMRASFATRAHDGYRFNGPAQNGDDADSRAARLSLLLTPTDKLSVLLTGEYVQLGGVGPTIVGAPLRFDATGAVVHERPVLPDNAQDFPLNVPSQFQNSKSASFRSTVKYDFGGVTATYIAGYRHLRFQRFSDGDGIFAQNIYFLSDETLRTQSHELRLASDGGGAFSWQFGGYYFDERNNLYSTQRGFPVLATQTTAQAANFKNYFRYPYVNINSKAAFAQAGYQISDSVKVEAGIRYSDDHKSRRGTANTATSGPLTGVCDLGPFGLQACPNAFTTSVGQSHDSKTTYHAAVNWQVSPRNLLFAKFDTGYKSGGFSDVVIYGPETITAYEVGSKNRFLNNKLQVNLSGYYYDYRNQQVGQLIQGRTQTVNAGASEIYGVELEANALLGRADRIDGSISYLHARFTNFLLVVDGRNTQLAGNSPPQSPELSINAGYEHDFDLLNGLITPRIQTHFETRTFLQVNNYNSDRQPAYTRTDFNLSYKPNDGNWGAQIYVRNIENSKILAFAQERPPFGTYTYQFEAPRTYGVELSYRF